MEGKGSITVEYTRELDQNYLVVEREEVQEKESYEPYMLEGNRIQGLLKCKVQRINKREQFYYEVTSRQPLNTILERKRLTYKDQQQLLKGLQDAISGAREYLLDVNCLLLEPEYVYMNLDSGNSEFCYFPYYKRSIREQFFDLAEYLLGKLDRQDRAGVEFGYEVYKMASEENCSLEEILKFKVPQEDSCPAAAEIRLFQEEPQERQMLKIAEVPAMYGEEVKKKRSWGKKRKQREAEKAPGNKVETISLKESDIYADLKLVQSKGETSLLSEGLERGLTLRSRDPAMQALVVKGELFIVGKKRDVVDGYINHPTVSRMHARIEKSGEEYILSDLNSTNGTYVNDQLLGVNESVRLKLGDMVRFADVEYIAGV